MADRVRRDDRRDHHGDQQEEAGEQIDDADVGRPSRRGHPRDVRDRGCREAGQETHVHILIFIHGD